MGIPDAEGEVVAVIDLSSVLLLILATLALTAVLVIAVVVSKIGRDQREARSAHRRSMMTKALESMDASAITGACGMAAKGSATVQGDFLVAIQRVVVSWTDDGPRTQLIAEGYADSGLRQQVMKQLRSRRSVRRGIAALLAGNPASGIDPMLLRPVLTDRMPAVRMAAAGALERIESFEAADVLIDGLIAGALPGPRLVERLGHRWAVDAICNTLNCDGRTCRHATRCQEPVIRIGLLQALGLTEASSAIPTLLGELTRYPDPEVTCQALRAIARCVPQAEDATKRRVEAIARGALTDKHPRLRTAAIEILVREGFAEDLPAIEAAVCDRDWFVRRVAAKGLLSFGPSGRQALLRIADGPDRYAADRAREELALDGTRQLEVAAV